MQSTRTEAIGKNSASTALSIGPLAKTLAEIQAADRVAVFRKIRVSKRRFQLRLSDELLGRVEGCRLRKTLVPVHEYTQIVKLLNEIDDLLRDELGINREPSHVAAILFDAQQKLMRQAIHARESSTGTWAPIIPLFPGSSGTFTD